MTGKILLLIAMVSLFAVLGCTSLYDMGIFSTGLGNDTSGNGQVHIISPLDGNETSNQSDYPPEQNHTLDYHDCFYISNFQYDAYGDDNVNLNDEYVTMQNICNKSINMTNWRITDAGRNLYVFPEFNLPADAIFILHSGCGTDSNWQLYWCNSAEVWDNDGDTLYMAGTDQVLYYSYSY